MTQIVTKMVKNWLKWTMLVGILLSLTACNLQLSGLLDPKGVIAFEERKLFFDTLALMMIVVLPVIIMSFAFIYHYQVSHRTRDYKPNWSHSHFLESLWWGIPCIIIVVLAVITWKKTILLDPYRQIPGQTAAPMVIQAIALPWKWVFIYPEENIATVNYVEVPVGREVEYQITADNVAMSAFFIPQLGSQIYAMAGMRTRLHLIASVPGDFLGLNTQFNGDGFSDMTFMVHAVEPDQMQAWVTQVKQSAQPLTPEAYGQLLNPSIADQPKFYNGVAPDLFQQVLTLYMNTSGTVHPRDNQLKFHNSLN
ncbi:MAG: COX aromatic rich motif-containing protein [Gammaproteobacteria bacterium]|nr:COX aromatic rich motif-containing protein [Gammaproteobacteria bacterium]